MEFELYKNNRIVEITTKYDIQNNNMIDLEKSNQLMDAELAAIKMPVPITGAKSPKKALLIGINYKGSQNELRGCINNVDNVAKTLVGFSSIVKLTDDTATQPTRDNIFSEFIKIMTDSVSGDCILFLFSGHGSNTVDTNGDESDGMDECLCTIDNKYIKDDKLNELITTYLKPNVTLFAIMDCCHSGTILDLKYQYLDYSENPKNIETHGNVIMISGCRDDQLGKDALINSNYQSALIWSFLKSLKKNITWRQLMTNMCASLAGANCKQTPKLSSGKFIDIDSKFIFA